MADPARAGGALRVPISFTREYAPYGGALCTDLRGSRPGLQIRLVPSGKAGGAAARHRPHLVVSDGTFATPGTATARIFAEPARPSEMRSGERPEG